MYRDELDRLYSDMKEQAKLVSIENVVTYFCPELTFPAHGAVVNAVMNGEKTSRVIDRRRNLFFWNAVSGNMPYDTIAVCMKIGGMGYIDTLEFLTGKSIDSEKKIILGKCSAYSPEPPKAFEMPEKNIYNGAYNTYYARCYLQNERGIPAYIVHDCLAREKPLIMQDNHGNAVFLGYDDSGAVKYASKRGTRPYTDRNTGRLTAFKRDAVGSDKRFAFRLVGADTSVVFVTESAIDALSVATLIDMKYGRNAYKSRTILSTGGAGIDNALEQFCLTHAVKVINVCFDDDDAGYNGMMKIKAKYSTNYIVNDMRSKNAHDYNDLLMAKTKRK